jgi:hypothetical protein
MGGLGAIVSKKINCKFFRLNRGQNNASGAAFARVLSSETKQRKRTKHEFWVKRGGFGAFISKTQRQVFFASTWPELPSGAGLARGFVDRNRNYENTPNMSFGSNGVDWVRSFKKSTASFFAPQVARTGHRGRVSHEFCRPKLKLRKRTKHEFWVKRGGLGAFVSKKSTSSFFASNVARTALGRAFARVLSSETRNSENAPNMSFGQTGWIGCVRCEKSTTSVFVSTMARTATRGGFRTSFVDRNQNLKTHKHEFWVKWGGLGAVRFEKINCKFFRFNRGQNNASGAGFARVCRPKPKLRKHTKHEFWVKRGGLGAFVSKNQLQAFSLHKWPERPSGAGLHEFCRPKPKLRKSTKHEFWVKRGDWVRSFRKAQQQVFSLQQWPELPSGAGFARVLSTETKTAKTHQT